MSRLSESARTAGFVLAWRAVRLAPESASLAVFERIADRIHAGDGAGVRRLRSNLRRAGSDDVRGAVRSYLRYWCESFRLPGWPLEDLVARTDAVDEHHVRPFVESGQGVVVALPHMANWDWAGAWATTALAPVMSVAERLRPERLFDEFVAYRESIGIHIVALTGDQNPMPALEEWVDRGGLVCLLADRDLSASSVGVSLLGETARFPVGPAVLAVRTGAPLVPVTLSYDGPRMRVRFHPPVPHGSVESMMQGVADAFDEALREHPVDWHMMQRVFESDAAVCS